MPNLLAAQALKLGPIVLETFYKHYAERISADHDSSSARKELLWDEAFHIVKSFLEQATNHTVEELQEFSNSRIPAPPWIFVERVVVPLSTCNAAATNLIKAFGGEEMTKQVVGGTKWWQVRGIHGVDCEWICQKSYLENARREHKARNKSKGSGVFAFTGKSKENSESESEQESKLKVKQTQQEHGGSIASMDGTRCMLYAHGGGYYFGSIDQERYCMQRYARKIHGRVFAVNYRLAPQYPFPCAIQDLLAAYLYLIDPPAGAMHTAVLPSLIVFAGDSAGGGLCLAVLQVIRDCGLPPPAAGVLISPWCDLTHSFPSTIENTATDIIPPYGLCLHRPSVLWPPPPDELASQVRKTLRERFRSAAKRSGVHSSFLRSRTDRQGNLALDSGVETAPEAEQPNVSKSAGVNDSSSANSTLRMTVADSVLEKKFATQPVFISGKLPLPWELSDKLELLIDGETMTVENQIQFYAPNNLLAHPLVSPALGYVGGLPPLLVIAGDGEVLRDEIIFLAHKAAHPDKYPINEDSKKLYPPMQNIEMRSTFVHLQVYDATSHVLPLFSFTTPAKYCYRAIAQFVKQFVCPDERSCGNVLPEPQIRTPEAEDARPDSSDLSPRPASSEERPLPPGPSSFLRKLSKKLTTVKHNVTNESILERGFRDSSRDSGDVAGNRFEPEVSPPQGPGTAGDSSAYFILKQFPRLLMIRERVSTLGVLRPMEPEAQIAALSLPSEHLGVIQEDVARRYFKGQRKWEKKFGKASKKIDNKRRKNLQLAQGETVRSVTQFQERLFHDANGSAGGGTSIDEQTNSSPMKLNSELENHSWGWSWVTDGEHPPPSSIVSRRDTAEARRLARIADMSIGQDESKLSGNRLWSILANFLTVHSKHNSQEGSESGQDRQE